MKKIALTIPKPCHEDWNAMTPQDRGRFCASCQKTVIDFSTMSDRQLAAFFKQPRESVCGHFSNSQLNRVIDVPKKRLPWLRYFFTIALPAFLFSLKAGAQGEVRLRGRVAVKTQPDNKDQCDKPAGKEEAISKIAGRVVDPEGKPVSHASVYVKHTNSGVLADADGKFVLTNHQLEGKEIMISAVGYVSQTIPFERFSGESLITLKLEPVTKGEYVITVGMVAPKKLKTIPLLEPKRSDTAFSKFAVYPNPVAAGSPINIEPKKMEAGSYYVQVMNSAGDVLQSTEVVIEKKTGRLTVSLVQLAAGPYFIRLTSRKTNKSYTEIIVVQ